jgi:hypothetical protein
VSAERDAEAARADRAEAALAGVERRHRRELRAGSLELEEAHRALQELSHRCRKLEAEAARLRGRQQETRRWVNHSAGPAFVAVLTLLALPCCGMQAAMTASQCGAGTRFQAGGSSPLPG